MTLHLLNLPCDLVLLILSWNKDPSLRTLGRTCRKWQQMVQKKTVCKYLNQALYQAPNIPLLHLEWLPAPVHFPLRVTRTCKTFFSFTRQAGISFDGKKLTHNRLECWKKVMHTQLDKTVCFPIAMDLTSESLRIVTGNPRTFVEFKRTSTDTYEDPVTYGIYPHSEPWYLVASAWSPTSFFALWGDLTYDGEIREYDFKTCTMIRQRPLSDLYHCEPDHYYLLYMTWFAGLLLFGKLDPPENEEEMECAENTIYHSQLMLLDWATNQRIVLPERDFRGLESEKSPLLATLQILGLPLMGISLRQRGGQSRVELWSPEDIQSFTDIPGYPRCAQRNEKRKQRRKRKRKHQSNEAKET